MGNRPAEEDFLALSEQYLALSEEHQLLLDRAAEAKARGDQDAIDKIAEAIDGNHVERRILLWRITRPQVRQEAAG